MKKRACLLVFLSTLLLFGSVYAEGELTRAEFCSIASGLYKTLSDSHVELAENPFTDTADPDVVLLYSIGAVSGISENAFAPKDPLTREQACVILSKVISAAIPESNLFMHKAYHFDDSSYISYWARDCVNYLYHYGVIKGSSDYVISPQNPVTRGEAEAMAERILAFSDGFAYQSAAESPEQSEPGTADASKPDSETAPAEAAAYQIEWLIKPAYQGGIGSTRFSGGLARVMQNNHFGYVNTEGRLAIDCIYDQANHFEGGFARVKKDGKYGFIDKAGRIAVPFIYDNAGDFSEGLAWVKEKDRYGYIDHTGSYVITPEFSYCGNFRQGLAAVCKDEKYGYIDQTGKTIIDFDYLWADDFSEGYAGVQRENAKCGFIDTNGCQTVPPVYDSVYPFSYGRAIVYTRGKYGIIDPSGEIIVPIGNHSYMFSYSEGLARVRGGGMWEGTYSYIDPNYNTVISSIAPDCSEFSEGLAWVRKNTNYGFTRTYIDRNGSIILPNRTSLSEFCAEDPYFSILHDFSEGFAAVETKDGKLGFIKNPLY